MAGATITSIGINQWVFTIMNARAVLLFRLENYWIRTLSGAVDRLDQSSNSSASIRALLPDAGRFARTTGGAGQPGQSGSTQQKSYAAKNATRAEWTFCANHGSPIKITSDKMMVTRSSWALPGLSLHILKDILQLWLATGGGFGRRVGANGIKINCFVCAEKIGWGARRTSRFSRRPQRPEWPHFSAATGTRVVAGYIIVVKLGHPSSWKGYTVDGPEKGITKNHNLQNGGTCWSSPGCVRMSRRTNSGATPHRQCGNLGCALGLRKCILGRWS